MDVKLKLKGSYLDCTTVPVYLIEEQCTDHFTSGELPDGSFDWDNASWSYTSCDITSTYVGSTVQCVWVDDGSGGGPGGDYIPPNPCDDCPSICPVCGGCKAGLLKSANEGCTPCTYPIVDAWDLEQNLKADCIYQKLINGSIMQNLINRYNALSQPEHAFLGELNLTWRLGVETRTIPVGTQNNGSFYAVEITLNESTLNTMSATNVALSMLHEALHAKLIAQVYDEVQTTDFRTLYAYYKGWGMGNIDDQQELQMIQLYADDMATALKEFDETQGIYHDLELYKEALRYDFTSEIFNKTLNSAYGAYRTVLKESSKNCN